MRTCGPKNRLLLCQNNARRMLLLPTTARKQLLEHSKGRLNYDPHELPRSFHAALFYHMCLGINFTLQTLYDVRH